MKRLLGLTLGLSISVVGCISEDLQQAASQAATTINASTYVVSKGASTSTEEGSYKSIDIEFNEFHDLPADYENEKLSSIGAIVFFKNLKEKDYEGYDKIEVTINREKTFVAKYDIEKLKTAVKYINTANDFIKGIRSITTIEKHVDTNYINHSNQMKLINTFANLDSLYGPVRNNIFNGFIYSHSEDLNIPAFVSSSVIKYDSTSVALELIMNENTGKFIYVGINAE